MRETGESGGAGAGKRGGPAPPDLILMGADPGRARCVRLGSVRAASDPDTMSYETFRGRDVPSAKAAMQRALGPDAVVLSSKRLPDGGVELRAIRKGQPLFKGEGGAASGGGLFGRATGRRAQPGAPSIGGLVEGSQDPLHARADVTEPPSGPMASLRGDITAKLSRDQRYADPLFRDYQKRLGRHGITDRFVTALAEHANTAPEHGTGRGSGRGDAERLSHALGQALRFAPITPAPGQPLMLVGQTGAGKTSTAAKLAARVGQAGGRLGFISADVGRAGALEQLTTYAEALDTRLWPVETPQDVTDVLRRDRPREALILDTPGVSPFARADIAAMKAFREALGAEPVLVIPASGDVAEHTDWVQAFADIGVRRCVVTKFDTSRRVGAALSACFRSGMALAHLSEAPFIAEGLVDANPDYLADRLLLDAPGRIASGR